MSKTYWQRLVAGLMMQGWLPDTSTTVKKYLVFKHPERAGKMFVGNYGALRYGATSGGSQSVGNPGHQSKRYLEILAAGEPKSPIEGFGCNPQPPVDNTLMGEGRTWEDTQS